jgi:hypothetical protein
MVDDGDVAGEELIVARLSVGDGIAKHGTLIGEMEATKFIMWPQHREKWRV